MLCLAHPRHSMPLCARAQQPWCPCGQSCEPDHAVVGQHGGWLADCLSLWIWLLTCSESVFHWIPIEQRVRRRRASLYDVLLWHLAWPDFSRVLLDVGESLGLRPHQAQPQSEIEMMSAWGRVLHSSLFGAVGVVVLVHDPHPPWLPSPALARECHSNRHHPPVQDPLFSRHQVR